MLSASRAVCAPTRGSTACASRPWTAAELLRRMHRQRPDIVVVMTTALPGQSGPGLPEVAPRATALLILLTERDEEVDRVLAWRWAPRRARWQTCLMRERACTRVMRCRRWPGRCWRWRRSTHRRAALRHRLVACCATATHALSTVNTPLAELVRPTRHRGCASGCWSPCTSRAEGLMPRAIDVADAAAQASSRSGAAALPADHPRARSCPRPSGRGRRQAAASIAGPGRCRSRRRGTPTRLPASPSVNGAVQEQRHASSRKVGPRRSPRCRR